MPRLSAQRNAYTLIEVMMAAAVLVVSFVAVMQAVIAGADMIDTARKQQIAQQIIDNEIGALRLGPWSNIAGMFNGSTSTFAYSVTVDPTGTFTTGDISRFALSSNIDLKTQAQGFMCSAIYSALRPSPSSPSPTFVSVTYTVTWHSALTISMTSGSPGRPHTRTGTAYFGQNGLNLSYQR